MVLIFQKMGECLIFFADLVRHIKGQMYQNFDIQSLASLKQLNTKKQTVIKYTHRKILLPQPLSDQFIEFISSRAVK